MKKLKIDYNNKFLEEEITNLKNNPLLANINLTLDNIIDASLYLEETNNCRTCKSLTECKNHHCGFYIDYNSKTNEFFLNKCDKKRLYDAYLKQRRYIKTSSLTEFSYDIRLQDIIINSPTRKEIVDYINKFLYYYLGNNYHKGMLLYGPYSKGKTFIMMALANELAIRDKNVLFWYMPDLSRNLKNLLSKDSYEDFLQSIMTADVLILDDLGAENTSAWFRDECLGPIINYRAQYKKPTFITTNLSEAQLLKYFSLGEKESLAANRIISKLKTLVDYFLLN